MTAKLNLSFEGIGEMLRADFMVAAMGARARSGLEFAEATAPFDPRDRDGDHYNEHFTAAAGVREGKSRRAVGTVTNDHPAALSIEFGTDDTPAHHTLLRALDVMGR